jgi:hypothetical protein
LRTKIKNWARRVKSADIKFREIHVHPPASHFQSFSNPLRLQNYWYGVDSTRAKRMTSAHLIQRSRAKKTKTGVLFKKTRILARQWIVQILEKNVLHPLNSVKKGTRVVLGGVPNRSILNTNKNSHWKKWLMKKVNTRQRVKNSTKETLRQFIMLIINWWEQEAAVLIFKMR